MSKSAVQRTPEENKERHDFKRKLREIEEEWNKSFVKEQIDELRGLGLRDNNPEQRESIHKE